MVGSKWLIYLFGICFLHFCLLSSPSPVYAHVSEDKLRVGPDGPSSLVKTDLEDNIRKMLLDEVNEHDK